MSGGTINGNSVSGEYDAYGGGVYAFGVFQMSGGTISGNSASGVNYSCGGGVFTRDGVFQMSGGTISGNSAFSSGSYAEGGGFYSDDGVFQMSGGTISGNSASGGSIYGGGVYISGDFEMSDGTISGNSASGEYDAYGGGVYSAYGFEMSGGTISGNSVSSESGDVLGGGVYPGSPVVSGTPHIQDNELYLPSGKVVYVIGALGEGAEIMLDSEETVSGITVLIEGHDGTTVVDSEYNYYPAHTLIQDDVDKFSHVTETLIFTGGVGKIQ
jgi:hypothetical protein